MNRDSGSYSETMLREPFFDVRASRRATALRHHPLSDDSLGFDFPVLPQDQELVGVVAAGSVYRTITV